MTISGVDYKWAGLYVALNSTQQEVNRDEMDSLVPVRRFNNGPRPGISNASKTSSNSWRWTRSPDTFSEEEKRKLLGKVVEIATVTTFTTHFYQWGGRLYRQTKGGPIGLAATGTIAKLAMENWMSKFLEVITKAGMKAHLLTKYVDDVLAVVKTVEPGARWHKGTITYEVKDILDDLRQ